MAEITPSARRLPARALICAALIAATLLVYAPVRGLPYLFYDDEQYVTENPQVQAGLSAESVRWAFTSFHASNWHPLTWLSHMVDVELFERSAAGPHVENAFLHASNACLVFLWLAALTGSIWRSAAVAALFALHPQRVESVAWISERKDLLCACFGLLALLAWTRFAKHGSRAAYAVALACMALGLLAKPMLVSLPLLLFVLDFWPLRRGLRIGEKLPFAALALASSLVTLRAQVGAISPSIAPWDRLGNALVVLTSQLGRAVWPVELAVLYPHPLELPLATVIAAAGLLASCAAFVLALRRSRPYLAAGLAWFVLSLAPTLGGVQVGLQATADRYTYLPQIGVWIAVVWAVPKTGAFRSVATALWVVLLVAFAAATRVQLRYWVDDLTLWRHADAVTEDNWFARTEIGIELAARGQRDEALAKLGDAVRIAPYWERAQANYGFVLVQVGRPREAVEPLRRALGLDLSTGGLGERHLYLARALEGSGRKADAISEYERHLALLPGDARAEQALARLRASAAP
jgi:tetratricopeptide (TPR) repeat protein